MPTYAVVNGLNPGPVQHPAVTLVGPDGAPWDASGNIPSGTYAPLSALNGEAAKALVLTNRGAGNYPTALQFDSANDTYPRGPWVLQVANVGTNGHDHVLGLSYNMRWNDASKVWERITTNEHTVHMGWESRWVQTGDPAVVRGQFEWNIDISTNLTGTPSLGRRPFFMNYDYDNQWAGFIFGDMADTANKNHITIYGDVSLGPGGVIPTTRVGLLNLYARDAAEVMAYFKGVPSMTNHYIQVDNSASAQVMVLGLDGRFHLGAYSSDPFVGFFSSRSGNHNFTVINADTGYAAQLKFYKNGANKFSLSVNANSNNLQFSDAAGSARLYVMANGNLGVGTQDFGSGVNGCVGIVNTTTPPSTTPAGGGVLYVESGVLKYRGTSGTVTTIAVA